MKPRAYYNDFDPVACAVLRELILEGLIPEGDVDGRSITEVQASDLVGYTQIHLFAGYGGWSLALRLAGWPDDRPVLSGSCPCPPFSSAGKKKWCPQCQSRVLIPNPIRTGIFVCCECGHEWLADGRHLWPEMYRLIREIKPASIIGEQVGGSDGVVWLTGVRSCLEAIGYDVGALDIPACGQGEEVPILLLGEDGLRETRVLASTPNIRQRLFWGAVRVADTKTAEWWGVHSENQRRGRIKEIGRPGGDDGRMENPQCANDRAEEQCNEDLRENSERSSSGAGGSDRLCDDSGLSRSILNTISAISRGLSGGGTDDRIPFGRKRGIGSKLHGISERTRQQAGGSSTWSDYSIVVCRDTDKRGVRKARRIPRQVKSGVLKCVNGVPYTFPAGSTQGDFEIQCGEEVREGIQGEVSTFPLAEAEAWKGSRVGLLKLAGNAINPRVGAEFVTCFIKSVEEGLKRKGSLCE